MSAVLFLGYETKRKQRVIRPLANNRYNEKVKLLALRNENELPLKCDPLNKSELGLYIKIYNLLNNI